MRIFDRYTIRTKLYISLICALSAIIVIGIYSVNTISKVGNIINTVNKHPMIVSNTSSDTQHLVLDIYKTYQEAFVDSDATRRKFHEAKIEAYEKELYSNMDIIQQLILGEAGKKLAKETRANLDAWKTSRYDLMDKIYDFNNREVTRAYLTDKEQKNIEELEVQLSGLQEYAQKKATSLALEAKNIESNARLITVLMSLFVVCFLFIIKFLIIKNILDALNKLKGTMAESTSENKFLKVEIKGQNEIVDIADHYNNLIEKLEVQFNIKDGVNRLTNVVSGDPDIKVFTSKAISFLCEYTQSGNGVFYIFSKENNALDLISSYAYTEKQKLLNHVMLGESIVGQVALERKPILLKNIKIGEGEINCGTISQAPLNIIGIPLIYEGELCGVIELSSFEPYDILMQEFLDEASEIIAVNIYSAMQSEKIQQLLKESQSANNLLEIKQAEVIKQSEELIINNVKLNELLETSRQQAEELQTQQEELRVNNEELEERTKLLEKQRRDIENKNINLTNSKIEIEEKSKEIEEVSRYKSEFLANMSHELRTPLNSILVLSQSLAEKKDMEPLTEKQLEYAKTINSAGNDLLTMINDVLDIAKVEAGKIELVMEKIQINEFMESILNQFERVAEKKGLVLETSLDKAISECILEDRMRLEQIVKNLISNAIKFTEKGSVRLSVYPNMKSISGKEKKNIVFAVEDTGIGIPTDKLGMIFEAFMQVDGTISRRFGGSGLGLSISMEYAKLMGGTILSSSVEGKGSRFELVLPQKDIEIGIQPEDTTFRNKSEYNVYSLEKNEKVEGIVAQNEILLIGNKNTFIETIIETIEMQGFKTLMVENGNDGFEKAMVSRPSAIVLNMDLNSKTEIRIHEMIKKDIITKDIPVHIFTTSKEDRADEMAIMDIQMFLKDVSLRESAKISQKFNESEDISNLFKGKKILLADDDMRNIFALSGLLEDNGIEVISARNGKEAISIIRSGEQFDLIIMDVMMPEMDGLRAMEEIRSIKAFEKLPIIALTAKAMKEDRIKCMEAGASEYITKPVDKHKILNVLKVWLYK